MKLFLPLIIVWIFSGLARAQRGDCDQRIKAAFHEARGGGLPIPEKYYAPRPGSCGGYCGRATGRGLGATRSDCGCNSAFIDGEGRTSGNIVEGFVDGLNRTGGYCPAVKLVTRR